MIDLRRRRFLGLLAAPAIVSITGKLQAALPPPLVLQASQLIVPEAMEANARQILSAERFRLIVEPILREHFDDIYRKTFREIDEVRVQPRSLDGHLRDTSAAAIARYRRLLQRHARAERARLDGGEDHEHGPGFAVAPK